MKTIILLLCLVLVGVNSVLNPAKSKSPKQVGPDLDVIELARRLGVYSFLLALDETGSTELVRTTKNITVFIPTNEAFLKLPQSTRDYWAANPQYYQNLMRYHVIKGDFKAEDLRDEFQYPTLAGSLLGRFNSYNHDNMPNISTYMGSVVNSTNFKATNGYIHFINDVVSHIQDQNMRSVLIKTPYLSTLLEASKKLSDFSALLTADAPHTLFAPTDDAFKKMSPAARRCLFDNPKELRKVLNYHVAKLGTYFVAGWINGEKIMTLNPDANVTISLSAGDIRVDKSLIIETNNATTNGVIHVIDTVLFPPPHQSNCTSASETAST